MTDPTEAARNLAEQFAVVFFAFNVRGNNTNLDDPLECMLPICQAALEDARREGYKKGFRDGVEEGSGSYDPEVWGGMPY